MTVPQPDDWSGLPEETKPAPTPTIEPPSRSKLNAAEKLEQQRVRMAVARDDPAFTEFCKKYERDMYFFILHLTGRNIQDAEDTMIETFVGASLEWYKIRDLEEKPRRSWLYKTASNKAKDHYRRLNARNKLLTRLMEEHQNQERLKDSLENERVWLLLDKLPKQERLSLLLVSQGFSIREIAEVLNVGESTVRGYLARGRQKYMRAAKTM